MTAAAEVLEAMARAREMGGILEELLARTPAARAEQWERHLADARRQMDLEDRNRRGWQAVAAARPAGGGPSLAGSLPVGGDRWLWER